MAPDAVEVPGWAVAFVGFVWPIALGFGSAVIGSRVSGARIEERVGHLCDAVEDAKGIALSAHEKIDDHIQYHLNAPGCPVGQQHKAARS